jgi:hypothetical protein
LQYRQTPVYVVNGTGFQFLFKCLLVGLLTRPLTRLMVQPHYPIPARVKVIALFSSLCGVGLVREICDALKAKQK